MNLNVRAKILISVTIPIVALIVFTLIQLLEQRENLLQGRKASVRHIVETGISLLDHYHALAETGQISDNEARQRAKDDLRALRFDDGNFLVVYRMDGVNEVLPPEPKLEGQQMIERRDPNGVPMVRQDIEIAKAGGGFAAYSAPRKAGEKPAPKISAILPFKPWDMLVVGGVYIDDIDATFRQQALRYGLILGVGVAAVLGLSLFLVNSITAPLGTIIQRMVRLSEGDKSVPVGFAGRRDEIGQLAKALEIFRTNAIALDAQEAKRRAAEQAAQLALQQEKLSIAARFEQSVMGLIRRNFASTEEMQNIAGSMSEVANNAKAQARSAANAAQQATVNVQTVASASEQLYASITEISRQVGEAERISTEASRETERIDGMMLSLSGAAQRIGEVVNLVNDIASQTNLLALNATIEAARAGEAGKGFTVVAGEVKTLAAQTARATDEISRQINAVQSETDRAVNAIKGITSTISQIREISSGISSSVEEQSAATQEIARNVSQAAQGTQEVSFNITGLSEAASITGGVAEKVLVAVGDLSDRGVKLRGEIEQFLAGIRES